MKRDERPGQGLTRLNNVAQWAAMRHTVEYPHLRAVCLRQLFTFISFGPSTPLYLHRNG